MHLVPSGRLNLLGSFSHWVIGPMFPPPGLFNPRGCNGPPTIAWLQAPYWALFVSLPLHSSARLVKIFTDPSGVKAVSYWDSA